MKLHVAYSRPGSNAWAELQSLPLASAEQGETGVATLNESRVDLPNGESLHLAATYWRANHMLTLSATTDGKTLLMLSTHRRDAADHSPQVVFLTPGGLHVSLMLGPSRQE